MINSALGSNLDLQTGNATLSSNRAEYKNLHLSLHVETYAVLVHAKNCNTSRHEIISSSKNLFFLVSSGVSLSLHFLYWLVDPTCKCRAVFDFQSGFY